MNFYGFSANNIDGKTVDMETYKGRVVLVVNTASKCGFTPQFAQLEELNKTYGEVGLSILGFPCNQFANQESGSNHEIAQFCQLNYGVTFDMFEKIQVNGDSAHPLFKYLKKQAKGFLGNDIKWNFTKFLIDSEGNVVKRYSPNTKASKIEKDIKQLL